MGAYDDGSLPAGARVAAGDDSIDGALVEGIVGFGIGLTGVTTCVSIVDGAFVQSIVGSDITLTGVLSTVGSDI